MTPAENPSDAERKVPESLSFPVKKAMNPPIPVDNPANRVSPNTNKNCSNVTVIIVPLFSAIYPPLQKKQAVKTPETPCASRWTAKRRLKYCIRRVFHLLRFSEGKFHVRKYGDMEN